jgi:hypothetical protein
VIYFDEVSPQKTRVTVHMLGYAEDEESQKMRVFFQAGNDFTLKKLQKRYAAKDSK